MDLSAIRMQPETEFVLQVSASYSLSFALNLVKAFCDARSTAAIMTAFGFVGLPQYAAKHPTYDTEVPSNSNPTESCFVQQVIG